MNVIADRYLDRLRAAVRKMHHPGHLITPRDLELIRAARALLKNARRPK